MQVNKHLTTTIITNSPYRSSFKLSIHPTPSEAICEGQQLYASTQPIESTSAAAVQVLPVTNSYFRGDRISSRNSQGTVLRSQGFCFGVSLVSQQQSVKSMLRLLDIQGVPLHGQAKSVEHHTLRKVIEQFTKVPSSMQVGY